MPPSASRPGARLRALVVKESRVLATEVDAEATVAYDDTRLAARATAARPRVRNAMLLGALLLAISAVAARSVAVGVFAVGVALVALRLARATLAPLVFAGLALLAALGMALWSYLLGGKAFADLAQLLVTIGLVAFIAPSYVVLLRDQELRHAYGLWARRS